MPAWTPTTSPTRRIRGGWRISTPSGPHSRGVHYLWFADGEYAYLSTGAKDFTPHNKDDDQFLMIVDLRDPAHPKETGRWWLPGTRDGDTEPPPPRVAPFDAGIRMHSPALVARAAGPRLYRLDRRRAGDPRHRRQGASEAGGAPVVAVGWATASPIRCCRSRRATC